MKLDLSFLESDQLTPCEAYTALWKVYIANAKRFSLLFQVLGIAATAALVIAILLYVIDIDGAAIVSGVGGVVVGGAAVWLRSVRNEDLAEAAKYLEKIHQFCPKDWQESQGAI
jgi:hypothetical protein